MPSYYAQIDEHAMVACLKLNSLRQSRCRSQYCPSPIVCIFAHSVHAHRESNGRKWNSVFLDHICSSNLLAFIHRDVFLRCGDTLVPCQLLQDKDRYALPSKLCQIAAPAGMAASILDACFIKYPAKQHDHCRSGKMAVLLRADQRSRQSVSISFCQISGDFLLQLPTNNDCAPSLALGFIRSKVDAITD